VGVDRHARPTRIYSGTTAEKRLRFRAAVHGLNFVRTPMKTALGEISEGRST